MITINIQFFGGRGSGGGKHAGGGGGGRNALNQSQLAQKMWDFERNAQNMTQSERESVMTDLAKRAAPGTSITVDNRAIGGLRGSSSGMAYEFRKGANGTWEEIFDDHTPVSSSRLSNMYVNSRGFKRRIR